jgi:hypothetical protein
VKPALVHAPGGGGGQLFNVTHFPSERSKEARFCSSMLDFFDFIFYHGLMDLPLVGGTFNWPNN